MEYELKDNDLRTDFDLNETILTYAKNASKPGWGASWSFDTTDHLDFLQNHRDIIVTGIYRGCESKKLNRGNVSLKVLGLRLIPPSRSGLFLYAKT